jgi:hypothetical protein
VTPASSWAPPGETRNPVTTSSKINRAPAWTVASRRNSRKPGAMGTVPKCPPVGSTMTAAVSPPASAARTGSVSFGGQTATRSTTSGGWLPSGGASYGGFAPTSSPSCQPWKWQVNFTNRFLPVKARARRTAMCVASVPEAVKRTLSAHGTRRHTHSPHSTSLA